MWWLSMATGLAISLLVYVTSAAHVLSFGPAFAAGQAASTDLRVANTGPGTIVARAGELARQGGRIPTVLLAPSDSAGAQPVEVPLPAGTVSPGNGEDANAASAERQVMYAVASDLPDVLTFYREELGVRGWHEIRSWMTRSVGTAERPATAVSAFCQSADGPAILLAVVSAEAGASSLHLRLIDAADAPCDARGPGPKLDTVPMY